MFIQKSDRSRETYGASTGYRQEAGKYGRRRVERWRGRIRWIPRLAGEEFVQMSEYYVTLFIKCVNISVCACEYSRKQKVLFYIKVLRICFFLNPSCISYFPPNFPHLLEPRERTHTHVLFCWSIKFKSSRKDPREITITENTYSVLRFY